MNFAPIFMRELRCREHRRTWLRQRLRIAFAAAAVLMAFITLDTWGGGLKITRLVAVAPFVGMAPFLLFIIGLHGASSLLSIERREGTLPLLLLTRLTGFEITFGKLVQSLAAQTAIFLAALPALVLPMLAVGFDFIETCLLTLACLNVLFFSLALGLLGSVFGDTRKTSSWCLFIFLPILADSTPFSFFLPGGQIRDVLVALQWLNPCAAVAHAPSAAIGFRPGIFWGYLLVTHAVAWCFAIIVGLLLPAAVRREAGLNVGIRRPRWWQKARNPRRPLLNRNPFLWLNSRDWATFAVWFWLVVPAFGWAWLTWLIWATRALNVAVVFAIAVGLSWSLVLLTFIPTHASRQLLSDRLSGALELILCTPVTVQEIARGIWLSLQRRFLLPLSLALLLSAGLMITGYFTSGFGGMLDPEDYSRWLLHWSLGIFFSPLALYALCWMSMKRALFARNIGEVTAIALLQVLGTVAFVLATLYWTTFLIGANPDSRFVTILLILSALTTFIAFALTARRTFLQNLRSSAVHSFADLPAPNLFSWAAIAPRFPRLYPRNRSAS